MFGYITPLKAELKVREFEYFKSYYHGLCYSIKNNYGNIPRLTLSYDMTFFGFLLDGLSTDTIKISNKRCIKHPTYDIQVIEETTALEYVAALSIIFFNYKLEDNIKDEKSFKSKVYNIFLSPYNKKASASYNLVNSIIKNNLDTLSTMELNKSFNSLDEICDSFSDIMGSILKYYPYEIKEDSSNIRNNLYMLGYSIGKFIYLMDALDDIEEDLLNDQFNPLAVLYNLKKDDYKSSLSYLLLDLDLTILSCISTCNDILNEVNFFRHKEILKNIITLGMPNKYYEICNKIAPPNI